MTDLDADVIVNKCPMKSTKSVGGSCGDTFARTQCKVLDLDDKTPQQPQLNCTFDWVWEAKVPPLHALSTQQLYDEEEEPVDGGGSVFSSLPNCWHKLV